MGTPDDEYDLEVGDLVRLLFRDAPPTEEEVTAVWRRWFGDYRALTPTKVAAMTDELRVLHAHYVHA
jgi:hypothetical protein